MGHQQDHDFNGSSTLLPLEPVIVVMFPFPTQGHFSAVVHLSHLLSVRGIPVHFITTAVNIQQITQRVQGNNLSTTNPIQFHDVGIHSFPAPPPDPNSSNKLPVQLAPTFEGVVNFHQPLAKLLSSLSVTSQRVVLVHDCFMAFAVEKASSSAKIHNLEVYCFSPFTIFTALYTRWEIYGRPNWPSFEYLKEYSHQLTLDGCLLDGFFEKIMAPQMKLASQISSGYIYNTCRPLEGKFIDILLSVPPFQGGNTTLWCLGPLVGRLPAVGGTPQNPSAASVKSRHKCLEWLDAQPQNSVLYVAFGTATTLSEEEINQLAKGLECSQHRFIWVFREADRNDVVDADNEVRRIGLPIGFEKRVVEGGMGVIVRDWAPQVEILAHPSTGGFLSHSGWNSVVESLGMGVPMAVWPMHSDHPWNAVLVTEVLKVGVFVQEWANRNDLVSSTVIDKVVRKLMDSDDGKDMRRRAEELSLALRKSVLPAEGMSSPEELDLFIKHISRS
ncbi:hypothetical protein C5167_015637 [Papaver somniferum]|uniref:Glycosyltransferase n=1 Tax=Papaver somniferum TaxID=3469 RepID=A0A4Y7J7I6_PAPSO|nr:zeatin O-glucosyltransferase-like [Papaver somniferum]RZC56777.1 hypothetical protein C5167_015637 [Papaver somniferum]